MISTKLLSNFKDHTAVIEENGSEYTYNQLIDDSYLINNLLKNRSLVVCLTQNTYGSFIGYISLIIHNHIPLLVDSGIDNEYLTELLENYKPDYLWIPNKHTYRINNSLKKISIDDYTLLEIHNKQDYIIYHKKLSLLLTTSGTTGSPKLVRLTHEKIFIQMQNL